MSSRFNSNLHQRDSRSALFSAYDSRASSQSPGLRPPQQQSNGSRPASGYGYESSSNGAAFSAYPGGSGGGGLQQQQSLFRSATPNSKGQYSDAVLNELESQNDEQIEGMTAKVKMLKELTVAIGDEIRSSTSLADTMNNAFENSRVRLRGTMNRMLRMAERTGISWKAWLAFFTAVVLLFWYVRLT